MNELSKTAIITGASSGIGQAIAQHLPKLGFNKLILIARRLKRLESIKLEIERNNMATQVESIALDITDTQGVEKKFSEILNQTQKINLLVNSAGYVKRGSSELALNEFEKMMQINLIATFHVTKLIVAKMKTQKHGQIINFSSISASQCRAELGGYAASKAGFSALSESLYKELAPYGIKVTAISPNLVDTEMTADVSTIPRSELTPVEDIVKMVELLLTLSPHSSVKEVIMQNTAKLIHG